MGLEQEHFHALNNTLATNHKHWMHGCDRWGLTTFQVRKQKFGPVLEIEITTKSGRYLWCYGWFSLNKCYLLKIQQQPLLCSGLNMHLDPWVGVPFGGTPILQNSHHPTEDSNSDTEKSPVLH